MSKGTGEMENTLHEANDVLTAKLGTQAQVASALKSTGIRMGSTEEHKLMKEVHGLQRDEERERQVQQMNNVPDNKSGPFIKENNKHGQRHAQQKGDTQLVGPRGI